MTSTASVGEGEGSTAAPVAAWTHCSWASKKATASLIYRVRARNQSGPKGGEATAARPKFRNTGKSILRAQVIVRAAAWPLTAWLRLYHHRHVWKSQQTWGMPLIFQRGRRGSAESTDLAKSRASHVWILDHWCQSFSCSICSILPLSLKIDTLLVPTTDSQFWEDLS